MTKKSANKKVYSEEIPWRDTKLYGITGCIIQPASERVPVAAFGGYFRYDVETKLVVDGQLIDCWGPSTIEGKMTGRHLSFAKKYHDRKNKIFYEFEKKKGLWAGRYHGDISVSGEARCRTYLTEKDAFDITCGAPKFENDEVFLLALLENILPVSERDFHMMMSIATDATGVESYSFRPEIWSCVDERFSGEGGHLPYSDKLHEDVEKLVERGYLCRDAEDPLVLKKGDPQIDRIVEDTEGGF